MSLLQLSKLVLSLYDQLTLLPLVSQSPLLLLPLQRTSLRQSLLPSLRANQTRLTPSYPLPTSTSPSNQMPSPVKCRNSFGYSNSSLVQQNPGHVPKWNQFLREQAFIIPMLTWRKTSAHRSVMCQEGRKHDIIFRA